MKTNWGSKLTLFIGFLTPVFVMVNCGAMQTQAVSSFSEAKVGRIHKYTMPAFQTGGAEPELPRVLLNTSYVPPTGRTIAVPAGGDFQAALNQAQPGEIITLQAGATYTGNFTLPAKSGSGWIVIRTSAPDSNLPPPGTRITPAYASELPKIVTPNSTPALEAVSGAHHFRLIGLEFALAPGVQRAFNLISLGDSQTSLALVPRELILDRVYVHGNPSVTLRRGILLNSASTAIIDSYISDCHEEGADSQAIAGFNGPGPFKIVNNYLEGAGENFILGGGDPFITDLVPSDIEFRLNHCFKPLSWRIGDPSYAGRPWGVKNLFELKNAQRVLIDGNIFENNWTHAQNGYAILFTVRNQDGGAPWSVVQDVTFTNNIVRRVASAFNMHGMDDNHPTPVSRRFRISNNLLEQVDGLRFDGGGVAFQLNGGPHDVIIEHNTIFHTGNVVVTGAVTERLVYRNNLFPHNEYGIKGAGQGTGHETINTFFPDSVIKKNVFVGGPSTLYPPDNFFPASFDEVQFVDRAGGNYRLAPSSPYKNAGTDGKDIGCDFDALNLALSAIANIVNVSAASFSGASLAPASIAAAFGAKLSSTTLTPQGSLPTTLGGTSIKVVDSAGVERLSPLFLVSPLQINFLVPANTALGTATVTVFNGNSVIASGIVPITATSPGIFTADANGRGLLAGVALRVKEDGSQQFEQVLRFDAAQNKIVAVPIDLGNSADQVFLIVFGSGIRFRSSPAAVTSTIGGTDAPIFFAGAQGEFVGLDQVNLLVPQSLAGRGEVDVTLTVDGKAANTVRVVIK